MIKLNITRAISHYNVNIRKPKQPDMTIETLASQVITNGRMTDKNKTLAMSMWKSGNYSIRHCTMEELERITKITGYPICKIISES